MKKSFGGLSAEPGMVYLDYGDNKPDMHEHAVRKYRGPVATGYDAKRENSPKWQAEQSIIEDMLADLPEKSWVLDVPVGTGRFLLYYAARKFAVKALDISGDMLAEAQKKADGFRKAQLTFNIGDVRRLELSNKSVDASVMCRLTRWLSPDDCQQAMLELQRVTRKKIIFTARIRHQRPEIARPYGLFTSVLDGWAIHRDEAAGDPDYRVIELRPVEKAASKQTC